ncbi:MAG: 50S ribosomal protein L17 [Chloroflexi bacterium GWB2_49_20]|nr:MAG: 50S ribosomal protein L17 [Chloroflexi bacterium GWB2_49_20]OGN76667.1 MAG: 50S ribosomal protein L17 [Chloroflexi bacterium GWC2_49_37]OGN83627.1 MAG: 50S ribosomal protein L17 [Chloroflexi bacterium GWD2_49_16]HBG74253.1 50S ribosomal protein L17 [Anaerolineae bacterium]HCM97841.1 50S ribosomal protein L17 [Anaerolineae bacterium]
MRHQVAGKKLNRSKGARNALRRTLIKQLFTHERIQTTEAKAAAIRAEAEKMITTARNSIESSESEKVAARRLIAAKLSDHAIVNKLFDEIAPRFVGRPGGYTRVLKLGPRLGDAANMVLLELVEE